MRQRETIKTRREKSTVSHAAKKTCKKQKQKQKNNTNPNKPKKDPFNLGI